MGGRHERVDDNTCSCSVADFTHVCVKLHGKLNHDYDEDAAETRVMPQVKPVGKPPPPIGR